MTNTISNKKFRVLTALMLLFAMLLTACGTVRPETAENAGQAAAEVPSEPTSAPEPTPEPTPEPFRTEVVFSELQPSNKATITDADGEFSDWIELYNPGAESEDLTGFWLSDSDKEPCKWQIPSLTLAAGEYRVIFCSAKDRSEGELHTNFAISKDGDTLYLSAPDGEIAVLAN